MKKLTPKAFQQAKSFIMTYGRQLEQRLFEYHFESGTKEAVLEALWQYQNYDGGFGHGFEKINLEGLERKEQDKHAY